jgi:hypothetical protein
MGFVPALYLSSDDFPVERFYQPGDFLKLFITLFFGSLGGIT